MKSNMSVVYWLCITIVLATFCSLVFHELQWIKKRRRLPPGPKGLPILGSIHLLGKKPHQNLCNLSQKHGSVMYMRFGSVPAIIVSSPEAAEKFLKTHDVSFASRPCLEAHWYMSYGQKGIVFAPYGSYWKNMRKLCITELLSSNKISTFESMRREELGKLINTIKEAAFDRVAVDLTTLVSCLSLDMSCLMIFGKKYLEEEIGNGNSRRFKDVMAEMSHYAAVPNLGDYVPFLGAFDFQGLTRKYKDLSKELDDFVEKIINDHVQSKLQKKTRDFVDTLMGILESGEAEFEFDRGHVKSVLLDMFTASTETTAASIDWAMAELLRYPNVMKKLQAEIQEKVGMERMIQESDLEGLEYLDAVVKETLRLHPAVVVIPHEAHEDCTVNGFHIKRKSRILINIWGIGHDPKVWPDPNSFNPERFIGRKIDVRGCNFELIPFGSGRRICPGINLGLKVVQLVLAQLIHCFDWELSNGMRASDMDMDESFGAVTTRAKHLLVVPHYRLLTSIN